ncbi:MAG: SprT family zinc-dependent metalloprotease [Deltaproteobacteria bacterium]|nr:SprT family zinc-dependent metalloprotease [Deltaproteobacteria bacterium]
MSLERSEVRFGSTAIRYRIRRSRRVKTVAVTVDPREGVQLTAPEGVAVDRLDGIVRRKARWIISKLRLNSELPPSPREFVSGETFTYLGRQYRLKVHRVAGPEVAVSLRQGWFVVEGAGADRIRAALVVWYRRHAASRLPERVAFWARKIGVPAPEVLIREQDKRWGSCDSQGRVRFNWRIVQAPMRLVDYVVAHELTHLVHRSHTAAFWTLLGKVMPDYEERRRVLGEFGRGVEW